MNELALITALFDYPDNYRPSFYNKASIPKEHTYIVRSYKILPETASYYDKLCYYKTQCVLNYMLEKDFENQYEYVLFMDATDTTFVKPIDESFISAFKSIGCSILFCAEKGMWPQTEYSHLYTEKTYISESQYLNSGVFFGYTKDVIRYLKIICEGKLAQGIDDQGQWSIQYLLNNDIVLDHKKEFFHSTYMSKEFLTEDRKFVGIDPYLIHDNGGYNDETIKLVDYLNSI